MESNQLIKLIQRLSQQQKENSQSKASHIVLAAILLGAGIGISILAASMLQLADSGQKVVVFILFTVGGLLLLAGLQRLVVGLVPNRKVNCPYCAQELLISGPDPLQFCPSCCHHIVVSAGKENELIKAICPVCKEEYGVSKECGSFVCHSCNSIVTMVNGSPMLNRTTKCPECGSPVQDNLCTSCGRFIKKPKIFDLCYDIDTCQKIENMYPDEIIETFTRFFNEASNVLNTPAGYIIQALWMGFEIRNRLYTLLDKHNKLDFMSFVRILTLYYRAITYLKSAYRIQASCVKDIQEAFGTLDALVGYAVKMVINVENGIYYGETTALTLNKDDYTKFSSKISKKRNDLLGEISASGWLLDGPAPGMWAIPVLGTSAGYIANKMTHFCQDWPILMQKEWYSRLLHMEAKKENLPDIRVPQALLLHMKENIF